MRESYNDVHNIDTFCYMLHKNLRSAFHLNDTAFDNSKKYNKNLLHDEVQVYLYKFTNAFFIIVVKHDTSIEDKILSVNIL